MVRQLKSRIVSDWKAMLVVLIAGSAVLWHILACTESPMSFSPDGTRLAFVTMEPYGDGDVALMGPTAYRLMVVERERKLHVLETSTTHMLTAPGFSPDGKHICYLRLPLMTTAEQAKMNAHVAHRDEAVKGIGQFNWQFETATTKLPADTKPVEDQMLPPASLVVSVYQNAEALQPLPVKLVIREAASRAVVRELTIRIPMKPDKETYTFNYLLAKPQYSPDGQSVYFALGGVVMAVNLNTGTQRLLATSTYNSVLSPDGKQLAFLISQDEESVLGLIRTDGVAATYFRWNRAISLSGIQWVDDETLAILEPKPGNDQWVHLVRTDGTLRKSIPLHMNVSNDSRTNLGLGELAMSPNGRYLVIALEEDVYFLNSSGKLERHMHMDKDKMQLAQPTFSPDSKMIAFKQGVAEAQRKGFSQITYYSAHGELIAKVPIPPLPAGTTNPAE